MAIRKVFSMTNNYFQSGEQGICTVASLQWAKKSLQRGRGLGSFSELGLSPHQMNAVMAVRRRQDNDPIRQTLGMGLRIVDGGDKYVNQFIDVQRFTNMNAPHTCIFWTQHHTMGYRVSNTYGRECEFFDIEDGLYVADNDTEIRQAVLANYGGAIQGMRLLSL